MPEEVVRCNYCKERVPKETFGRHKAAHIRWNHKPIKGMKDPMEGAKEKEKKPKQGKKKSTESIYLNEPPHVPENFKERLKEASDTSGMFEDNTKPESPANADHDYQIMVAEKTVITTETKAEAKTLKPTKKQPKPADAVVAAVAEGVYALKLEEIAGIGPAKAKVLRKAGVTNVIDLAVASSDTLSEDAEIARPAAEEMIHAAQDCLRENNFLDKEILTGKDIQAHRDRVQFIKTGSVELDTMLKGGIETMAVTELYAVFGGGKTQLCHTLAVRSQLPVEDGGLGGSVMWIDTEQTFRPERIAEIAKYVDLDYRDKSLEPEKHRRGLPYNPMDRIIVSKMYNASHLELLVEHISKYIGQYNIKLLVIDSITNLHRKDYPALGKLADRQQRLNSIMAMLVKVADVHNVAIVITNQVMTKPEAYGDPIVPIGGNTIAHSSTYRMSMTKSKGDVRIVRMVDSPYHPYSDCRVQLSPAGIIDEMDEEKPKKKEEATATVQTQI